jgi:hypothetical protein
MRRKLILSVALITFLGSGNDGFAQQQFCKSGPTNLAAGYDEAVGSITVMAGKRCDRAFNSTRFLPNKILLIERPRFGKVIVNGSKTWSYIANAGYEGADSFKIRYLVTGGSEQTGQTNQQTVMGIRYSVNIVK